MGDRWKKESKGGGVGLGGLVLRLVGYGSFNVDGLVGYGSSS